MTQANLALGSILPPQTGSVSQGQQPLVIDYNQLGQSYQAPMSLGQLADAYLALSVPDQARFRALIGVEQPQAQGPTTVSSSSASAVQRSVRPSGGQTTTDPQTGKVYKVTPPKRRSAEYSALKARRDRATEELGKLLKREGWEYSLESGETLDQQGNPVNTEVLRQLQENLEAAKLAVQQYKTAHPEEFREQPQGRTGPTVPTRGRGRGRAQ